MAVMGIGSGCVSGTVTKSGYKSVRAYSEYLTGKYRCLTPCPSGAVVITPGCLRKAMSDEKTAEWLEENLSIMPDVLRNAQQSAIRHGSRLLSVEFKFTENGTEMTTCGVFGETGTAPELERWLEWIGETRGEKTEEKARIDKLLAETNIINKETPSSNPGDSISAVLNKDIEGLDLRV